MVNILLRLAPDRPETSAQSIEQSLLNSPSIPDLMEEAEALFAQLDEFSLLIYRYGVPASTREHLFTTAGNCEHLLVHVNACKY